MRRVVISTDNVPESDRFSYWREAVFNGLIGYSVERDKDQDHPFTGQVLGLRRGSIAYVRSRADGCMVFRRSGDIARRNWGDHFTLYRERGAGAWFGWDRGEIVTRPGDLVIRETTLPFAAKARTTYDYDMLLLPRKLLDPHLPVSRRPRNLVVPAFGGVARIAKAYMDAFAGQIEALDDPEVGLVADNFCRLLAVLFGAGAGEQHEPIRLARLEEVKRYIGLHLADPELTPEKTAAALKISVRQLHLLFEPSGTSFVQHVVRRRLEECRAALMAPSGARSVTDVALAWGFNSLATFHRNFRQAFGATPGELRAQVGRA
jgi:AraC-like DNA-binding protein